MTQTIAELLKWNFEIDGDLVIETKDGQVAYSEDATGYWERSERDDRGNQIYWESSKGLWEQYEYDSYDNRIKETTSNGFWAKWEYDFEGNEIYYKNSNGTIRDNRPNQAKTV